jgi:hypothetical protein
MRSFREAVTLRPRAFRAVSHGDCRSWPLGERRQNRKAGIEVWPRTGATRLYRIAYPKPTEDAMDAAREQAKTASRS